MYEKSLGINLCSLGQKEWSGCIISLVLEESGVSLGEEQGSLFCTSALEIVEVFEDP